MFSPSEILKRSPNEIATAVVVLLNLASILEWFTISKDGVSAANIAIATVLGLFYVKQVTVNKAGLVAVQEAVDEAAATGGAVTATKITTGQPKKMKRGGSKGQASLVVILIVLAVVLGIVGIVTAVKWLLFVALAIFVVGLVTNRRNVR